jgi:predicted metalloendopeptidase
VNRRLLLRIAGASAALVLGVSALAQRTPLAFGAAPPVVSDLKPGLDLKAFDRTCNACDDFYRFADGAWIKNHPIPASYAAFGKGTELSDANRGVLHGILDAAAANPHPADANEAKVGRYYKACMNEAAIEANGTAPLAGMLADIAAIADTAALSGEFGKLAKLGMDVPFATDAGTDLKNSSEEIFEIAQGGLGLPNRDYYFGDEQKPKRDAYVKHVANLLVLLGDEPAKAADEAAHILTLETAMAKASLTNVQLRDPVASYHRTAFADFVKLAPDVKWQNFGESLGVPHVESLNVAHPEFLKAVDALVVATPLPEWQAYLRAHLAMTYGNTLPKAFVDENFAYGSILSGAKTLPPRWKRCASATDNALGEALGAVYVKSAFPPAAKARALALVDNLVATLHDDITTLSWMSKPTQKRALVKLAAIRKKIGYPDRFRSYDALAVGDVYAANVVAANAFENARQLAKIGKPVDRGEWGMTPPTVNAYYNPAFNEIVFPAGILQTPFFNDKNDDALNYGAAGAVIGHEMTHGFDDEGRQFDEKGNLADWWQPSDAKNFDARAKCIADQFDAYTVAGGVHENGKLETGEAIADLGGLTIAYKAFERAERGKPRTTIDGFTPEQRFFVAYAQIWANNVRPQSQELQAKNDPHPLPNFRVLGTLSNMPEFARAFACPASAKMVRPPSKRCSIW